MTSRELEQILEGLRVLLEQGKSLPIPTSIPTHFPKVIESTSIFLDANDQDVLAQAQKGVTAVILEAKRIQPSKFFVALARWIEGLIELERRLDQFGIGALSTLIRRAEELDSAYERFVQSYDRRSATYLIVAAHEVSTAMSAVEPLVNSLSNALVSVPVPKPGCAELTLYLGAQTSFKTLQLKLSALESIYAELCRLLNVSVSEYPLEIMKLEAGSLWMRVFGESRVMNLMGSFIEKGVSFLHRNFTREGKIQAIPKDVEVINSLLDLSNRLEESGIDNNVLNENLKHSAITLSQNLNQLLAGEANVDINGRPYSLTNEMEQRFLKENRMLFIGTGEENQEPTRAAEDIKNNSENT